MSETRYLTREQAASACAVSEATIRRDDSLGKYPNRRVRADGVVEIPVSELVAAGRLDPLNVDAPLEEIAKKSKLEREVLDLRQELAVVTARFEGLRDRLRGANDEISFLRGIYKKQVA